VAENAMQTMYIIALPILAAGALFGLFRAICGPRVTDRIMGINMAGTIVIISIAVLSFVLKQSNLLDICLLYCLLNFFAVVVLAKVFISRRKSQLRREREEKGDG